MTLLAVYFMLAVLVSFACSLMEAVILSVSPAYIAVRVKNKRRSGTLLQELKQQIDRPLAAILTLNTIANTVGATGVGAQVTLVFGDQALGLASGILTFVILVFSEIIPKTLGATHWKKLAPACAYIIRVLIFVTYPFVILSKKISEILRGEKQNQVTREEMIETAALGAVEGTLDKKESRIIHNLLMLDKVKVCDILTPRSVLYAHSSSDTVDNVMNSQPIRYSRIPLFTQDLDNIQGLLHRYKVMEAASKGLNSLKLSELMTPIHSIPESVSVAAALDQFIKRREHLFLVVDEYGSTAGIVTLEDAIETLLGVEIMDEFDSVEDLRQYAAERWKEKKNQGQKWK